MLSRNTNHKPKLELTNESGFALVSILIVIVALSVLGAVALESIEPALAISKQNNAQHEMAELGSAIAGSYAADGHAASSDFGYVGDVGNLPSSLADLQTNPGAYSTWRGPYITDDFTEASGEAFIDPWGTPYALDATTLITSTGSGSTIEHRVARSASDLTDCAFTGIVVGANNAAPGLSHTDIIIVATYPNGTGAYTSDTATVSVSGSYSFPTGIPIGIHSVQAFDTTSIDSASTFIRIIPRSNETNTLASPLRLSTVNY